MTKKEIVRLNKAAREAKISLDEKNEVREQVKAELGQAGLQLAVMKVRMGKTLLAGADLEE